MFKNTKQQIILWQTKKLGEVCNIVNGSTPLRSNKEFWVNGNIPWFTIDDIRDQGRIIRSTKQKITEKALSKTRLLPPQTVLLCCTASVGEYAITEIKLTTNQQFNGFVIKNKKILDPFFLFYVSSTLKDQLLNLSGKTTIDFIPISRIKEIQILFPPLTEQHRIVKILDNLFTDVVKAKENAQKNLQNAKELFESYLQSIFVSQRNGWEENKLGDVLQKTETINPRNNPSKEFIYIDVSSVNKENLAIENTTLIKGKDAPSRARRLIKTGDIIFATVRPTLRRIAIIPKEFNEQVCSTGYFVFRAKENLINKLVFYFIRTKSFNGKMEKLQKGASYPAVTDRDVKNQVIFYPKSIAKQKSIVKKLDTLSVQTQKLEAIYQQKLTNLEELKKSVLKKAFAGEL